jgi:AraC family transcriptional regulator
VTNDYEARIERVVAYIYEHLDDPLDLNRLAEVACLSPYHWHRVYKAMRGETIATTIKRQRLTRAAARLAQTSMPIEQVARDSGYDNVQSFTRIFKSIYGMPPATYRARGSHRLEDLAVYDVQIKRVEPMTAITLEHRGAYIEISRAFDRLFAWLYASGSIGPDLRSVAIFYDDPTSIPAAQLRSRAGVVTRATPTLEPPFECTPIAGGEYAVLRHKGPYADMKPAYDWLYGQWLPQSGRLPADAPCVEEYLNNPRTTVPTELLSDIYLPLREITA